MIELIPGLLSNFLQSEELKLAKREVKSKAISSLHKALRATTNHIRDKRIGEFGDDNFVDFPSDELSNLWSNAAQDMRLIDFRLASTFEDKSGYWSSPHGFFKDLQEQGKIFEDRMRLHNVINELRKLERTF